MTLILGSTAGWWLGFIMGRHTGYDEGAQYERALASSGFQTPSDTAAAREIELETRIWHRPLLGRHPIRLPKPESRALRVISFFNLKGGVGKTSLTANVAATLVRRGKKVLVIDLDHQQSLTGLCLTAMQVAETRRSQIAVQHIFDSEMNRGDLLHQIYKRVRGAEDTFGVIPAHHELAEKEDLSMLKWLRENGTRDIRFAFTAAVLNSRFKDWADYILLDCPPRLTTASVNALAASDFIVAPVLPDAVSTDAVQFLVKHLHQLGDLLPDPIGPRLGLVANRCGAQFTLDERFWNDIIMLCPQEWRPRITGFRSPIRERVAFRDAAAQSSEAVRRFAIDIQDDTAAQFAALVDEIELAVRPSKGNANPAEPTQALSPQP
ncbi:MAG: ParA family protein [Roseimicrobium sp.]